ncbi:MAG TPA: glycosyl hydrolase family 8 [Polyangiaceae bacterium]|nr:glycosyl hydrolase family 8 [Polyangiaceae bacterium]
MTRKLTRIGARRLARHTHPRLPSPVARSARAALAIAASGVVLGSSGVAAAQQLGGTFPFPSTNVSSGVKTGALTTHELRQLYLDWRDAVVEQCPQQGDARVRYPETNNDTRSEGIGYGMVIAAYMGDQPTFDGLWRYYQRTSSNGLMNWKRNGCDGQGGGGDNGSAADADIDAALALIVADKQFPGSGYAADAGEILGAIRGQLFDAGCQGVLMAGNQFGGCDCVNPSYIPPGYYVAYGSVEQQAFWTQARDASYTYFNAVSNPMTGLVPAWSQVNGSLQIGCGPQVAGGGGTNEYQADAARTPWRVAIDYQWTGDARAQDFLQSIGGFAAGQQIMRIRDRYTLAGQRANANELSSIELGRNTYVMGGFATAMVAGTQQQLDDFTAAWISVYKAGDNFGGTFRAFNNSLALLYGLVVTGTMWAPSGPAATRVAEAALTPPAAGNLVVNGDFEEGVTGWETNSGYYDYGNTETFTNSDGFAKHQNGEMVLRVVNNEPAAPGRLSFQQTVNLQAGQRYLLSVSARSSAARPVSLSVRAGDATLGSIATAEDGTFTVDTEKRTYQTVFEATTAAPDAAIRFEFGQASQDVIIDDVVLAPTDLPIDPGSAVGGAPPAAPTAPTSPGANGGGAAPAGNDGTLGGVAPPGQDLGGGSTPPPVSSVGGSPASNAAPPGNAAAPSAQNCAPAAYSAELNLCFDPNTGLVWDASQNAYTLPPTVDWCGADEQNPGRFYYWWPLLPACYDAASGYAYNSQLGQWVFVGTDFVRGQRGTGSDDSGCSIGGAGTGAGGEGWTHWALLGLAGAAVAMRRRR